jgi:hypothetical protein
VFLGRDPFHRCRTDLPSGTHHVFGVHLEVVIEGVEAAADSTVGILESHSANEGPCGVALLTSQLGQGGASVEGAAIRRHISVYFGEHAAHHGPVAQTGLGKLRDGLLEDHTRGGHGIQVHDPGRSSIGTEVICTNGIQADEHDGPRRVRSRAQQLEVRLHRERSLGGQHLLPGRRRRKRRVLDRLPGAGQAEQHPDHAGSISNFE